MTSEKSFGGAGCLRVTGTTAVGKPGIAVFAETDIVINALTGSKGFDYGTFSGVTIKAGNTLYGSFDNCQLTSGTMWYYLK